MKVVILAGGKGTRFAEQPSIPKPMIEIGDKPILWYNENLLFLWVFRFLYLLRL